MKLNPGLRSIESSLRKKIEQPFFYLSTTTKQIDKFLIQKVKWKQYQFVLLMSTFF